jgi:copper chaperone
MKLTIKIPDMTCDHCKMAIEKALKNVAGVEEVRVNLTEKLAQVSGNTEVNPIVHAIRSAGYAAAEIMSLEP